MDAFKQQVELDQTVIDLIGAMKKTFKFVDIIQREPSKLPVLEETITNILLQTTNTSLFIRKYASRSFGRRLMHAISSDDDSIIENMQQTFSDLHDELFNGLSAQAAVSALRIESDVTDIKFEVKIRKLGAPDMDRAGRALCLPGTRLDKIDYVSEWATQLGDQNLLWIHGLAGSGKSTLAMTLADLFDRLQCLGACIYFDKETSDPRIFVKALAAQLAEYDGRIGDAIVAAIHKSPNKLRSDLATQFDAFILKPLMSPALEDIHNCGPIMIIVDALDQCGNAQSPQSRETLLKVLRTEVPKLPSCYRIIVTSRAERDIYDALSLADSYELDIISEENADDIMAYLREELARIPRERRLNLPPDWPGEVRLAGLVRRAAGLFIWAVTAAIFIRFGQSPDDRLNILLEAEVLDEAEAALNALYITALQSLGQVWEDPSFSAEFQAVVGIIVAAYAPLTCQAIDQLRAPNSCPAIDKVMLLGSVMTFEPHPIRTLHLSFDDFITNLARCREPQWHIDLSVHNYNLAEYCINCLVRYFATPVQYESSKALEELRSELPEAVAYAGTFWLNHVCKISNNLQRESIIACLSTFLHRDFLHWLEILSILGKSRDAIKIFGQLHIWIRSSIGPQTLEDLARDGYRFMQTFADTIEQHPFMVYNSALAFVPTKTSIYSNFYGDYPWVVGGFQTDWQPIFHVIAAHKDPVNTVLFSPDDTLMFSGSEDCSIRQWDTESGAQVGPTLRGHARPVRSMAMNVAGSQILSASMDGTLRTWNVVSGEEIQSLRRAHGAELFSVTCSPDGELIAASSSDTNIYLWKRSEIIPFKVLSGHTQAVMTIQFFPDGIRLVSASVDSTVGLWNLQATDTPTLLRGHQQHRSVLCAVVSPDGSRLASSSQDRSIRLWDGKDGTECAHSPLWGHEHEVSAVTFSPNGKYIASGSVDQTVRLWNVKSGSQIWKLPRRHARWVSSVAFSHDSKCLKILAGSADGNVRVWDASSKGKLSNRNPLEKLGTRMWAFAISPDGKLVASGLTGDHSVLLYNPYSSSPVDTSLRGHIDRIETVAFSPDSKTLLSGSQDCSLRLWNVATGQYLHVMTGHINSVFAVAFAPSLDCNLIASGSDDNTARLWSSDSGDILHILRGHEMAVTSVAISSDNELLVSGSEDGVFRIWHTKSGEQRHLISDNAGPGCPVLSVVFGPRDEHVLASFKDGSLRTWDIMSQSYSSIRDNFLAPIKQDLRYPNILCSDGNILNLNDNRIVSRLTAVMSVNDVTAATSCQTAMAFWENTAYIYILSLTLDVN
ncbi:hypothetical protein HWV62_439 [Athelia sp. TMB]|nr:hypothetical protein HWV62_16956 [Athelia sp. TMB]KAF7985799.1 hypothetical protein HWV62_439 [Athelia sp. TMB]